MAERRGFVKGKVRPQDTVCAPELVKDYPLDAKRYGVGDGEEVFVETPDKKIRLKAHLTEEIKPGVIGIIHGWEGAYNENVLAKNRPNDPVTGYPALMRNFACRLAKI